MNKHAVLVSVVMLCLTQAGCKPEPAAEPRPSATPAAAGSEARPETVALVDVIETSPSRIIGISYPHDASIPAGLAGVLQQYAGQARDELQMALDGLGNDQPRAPYELSLSFTVSADTPALMAVSADGSRYTGGAHGQPLMARFVWLKQQQRLLPIDALITEPASRAVLADYVQNALVQQMENRLRADQLSAEELASARSNARRMINEGTAPEMENFSQFLPVVDRQGQITALRFVFPPYQVGPYSDGTQTVDVPVSVLLPYIAAEFRGLFAAG